MIHFERLKQIFKLVFLQSVLAFFIVLFLIFFLIGDLPWHKTMISSIQQYKKSGMPIIIIQILTWHKNIVCINWIFFSAVDLIQHKYLDILYNYIYNKVKYDKSAIFDILKPSIKTNGVHWEKLWFKIVYPFNDLQYYNYL
jgi:hypothetical protein